MTAPGAARRELIGPTEAKGYLATMKRNRPCQLSWVMQLAGYMRHGQWRDTGDPIQLAIGTGELLNGQHRMRAIIESGEHIWFWVIEVPADSQDVMDRGRRRTLGDVLSMHGYTQGNLRAAALRWVRALEQGKLMAKNERGLALNLTPDEVLAAAVEHDGIEPSIRIAKGFKEAAVFRYPPSLAGALHYVMTCGSSAELADEFFAAVLRGEGMARGDPPYTLREQLMFDAVQRTRRDTLNVAEWTVRTWNMWREGRPARRILSYPERPFPQIFADHQPAVFSASEAARIYYRAKSKS